MNPLLRTLPSAAALLLLLALCAASLLGCTTANQLNSSGFGAAIVKGRSEAEIRQVTKVVFAENGYSLASEGAEYLVFDRPGSQRDALKWGGWDGAGVVIRAKVKMTRLAEVSYSLQLDMVAVHDAGQGIMESENPMMTLNKRPYNRLMDEIGKRLKTK